MHTRQCNLLKGFLKGAGVTLAVGYSTSYSVVYFLNQLSCVSNYVTTESARNPVYAGCGYNQSVVTCPSKDIAEQLNTAAEKYCERAFDDFVDALNNDIAPILAGGGGVGYALYGLFCFPHVPEPDPVLVAEERAARLLGHEQP